MSADRELLELAAKAAGILYDGYDEGGQECDIWWVPELSRYTAWNPLTDDGDALRLAVRLRITPHIDGNLTDAESMRGFSVEAHFDDPYAATRRAIVRAAAEIGRAMP